MRDKVFGVLQRVGRSFMLPVAILPVAGLLLGIGSSFTNETMLQAYGLMEIMGPGTVLNMILTVMSQAGNVVFDNLPIIFAMGVAIGMAKKEKEVAALSSAIAFFIMHASISAMITNHGGAEAMLDGATASVVGITSLQMGVFGGIVVGLGVAALHNRFYKIQLPQVLSFFGGTRFVPIISGIVYTFVGIVMYYIWPVVQTGIYGVGDLVLQTGYAGTWVYGLMERLLIPFGLHHVFTLPFWQTAVGGTMEVAGEMVAGAQRIFFAQLADPSVTKFSSEATRFMSGKFPLMIFGLPGAALAMYRCAKPEKKKAVSGLLLSAALTSMLTGITEPLEFTFLFVAPLLYGIHCVFAGGAYMLMHIFDVGVGMTFSGGLIDLFLFGILPGNAKTNWIWVIIVGIVYFIVYYVLFSFLITKMDLKTPGRDDSDDVKLYRRADMEAKKNENISADSVISAMICKGLGGKQNISDVDCCITRLRCTVFDPSLVDDQLLKSTGASGVMHKGQGIQIVYGPEVVVLKSELDDYLKNAPDGYENVILSKVSDQDEAEAAVSKEKNDHTVGGVACVEKEDVAAKPAEVPEKEPAILKTVLISSPMDGRVVDISEVPDRTFASRMIGDGAAIVPISGDVKAPADGTVSYVFPSKHAVGMKTEDGLSILVHVGIDTVELKGEGFEAFVSNGDVVKKGDLLLRADLDYIRSHASADATPVICSDMRSGVKKVRLIREGDIACGEDLFAIDIYEF